jgi:hypothetical protein
MGETEKKFLLPLKPPDQFLGGKSLLLNKQIWFIPLRENGRKRETGYVLYFCAEFSHVSGYASTLRVPAQCGA